MTTERPKRSPAAAGAAEWLSARDVAARLKISRSAAFALIRKLPRLKIGRITRVCEEALNAFVLANMQPPRQDATLEAQLRATTALLRSYEASERAHGKGAPMPSPTRARDPALQVVLPAIRPTRRPVKLPFDVSAQPPPPPEHVDYARLQAELSAKREAAIRKLEATPVSKLTGKERNEMRRLFGYADQVQYGLRKER